MDEDTEMVSGCPLVDENNLISYRNKHKERRRSKKK